MRSSPKFLLHAALQDADDLGLVDELDHRVEGLQDEPFAERHLERDVLLPRAAHHAGRQEPHDRVRGRGRHAEDVEDAQEIADVLELFDGLLGEELGSI